MMLDLDAPSSGMSELRDGSPKFRWRTYAFGITNVNLRLERKDANPEYFSEEIIHYRYLISSRDADKFQSSVELLSAISGHEARRKTRHTHFSFRGHHPLK